MEFSQIALQKLIELFPELAKYIITFKDITEEANKGEDSDVGIGVFVLQFGKTYFYIPVLAKGETVQPIDSIFNTETQTFLPLTKEYVTQAINSSQLLVGKTTKIPKTVIKNPSVYDMVTPPRTGKYVYASSSRLTEFLATMPNMVKKAMLSKFSEDKEIYDNLHKLFGLENVLSALSPTPSPVTVAPKPAVEIVTDGVGLPEEEVKSILSKGYALRGENKTERVAILANDYQALGPLKQLSSVDAGQDYSIVTKSGELISAYIPKRSVAAPQFAALLSPSKGGDPVFALYSNCDYSISGNMVARGEGLDDKKVLSDLFAHESAYTPKDIGNHTKFALLSPTLDLVGVFQALEVTHSDIGVSILARNLIHSASAGSYSSGSYGSSSDLVSINASRNCVKVSSSAGKTLFVPYNTITVKLKDNISNDLEVNANAAFAKLELNTLTALGSAANIGYDGIEFSFNGTPVGSEVKMIELLVGKEGIEPAKAESFIKQAKVSKHVKVYMSKVADFEPGEIPQYGNLPTEQASMWDFDKGENLVPKVKQSMETQDPQTVEATIISELLQVSNMKEYVKEYMPDIKECIDKLGRTLFLARLNMTELSKTHSASEVMSFVSNLRNVYRMLGDNYVKLEQMVADSENSKTE
jgi:hypothetical protein